MHIAVASILLQAAYRGSEHPTVGRIAIASIRLQAAHRANELLAAYRIP